MHSEEVVQELPFRSTMLWMGFLKWSRRVTVITRWIGNRIKNFLSTLLNIQKPFQVKPPQVQERKGNAGFYKAQVGT